MTQRHKFIYINIKFYIYMILIGSGDSISIPRPPVLRAGRTRLPRDHPRRPAPGQGRGLPSHRPRAGCPDLRRVPEPTPLRRGTNPGDGTTHLSEDEVTPSRLGTAHRWSGRRWAVPNLPCPDWSPDSSRDHVGYTRNAPGQLRSQQKSMAIATEPLQCAIKLARVGRVVGP